MLGKFYSILQSGRFLDYFSEVLGDLRATKSSYKAAMCGDSPHYRTEDRTSPDFPISDR